MTDETQPEALTHSDFIFHSRLSPERYFALSPEERAALEQRLRAEGVLPGECASVQGRRARMRQHLDETSANLVRPKLQSTIGFYESSLGK